MTEAGFNRRLALDVLLVYILLPTVVSVTVEQASSTDWYKQHLGTLQNAVLGRKHSAAYVGSVDGIIARLNLQNGDITWRKVQSSSSNTAAIRHFEVLPKEDGLLTVVEAPEGTFLRVWRESDGQMVWETVLHMEGVGTPQQSAAASGLTAEGVSIVLAVFAGQVKAHSLGGKILWYESLEEIEMEDTCSGAVSQGVGLLLCGKMGGKTFRLWRLKLSNGARDGPHVITLPHNNEGSWSSTGTYFVSQAQGSHMCAVHATAGTSACHTASTLGIEGHLISVTAAPNDRVLLVTTAGITLVGLQDNTAAVLASVAGGQAGAANTDNVVITLNHGHKQGLQMKVLSLQTGAEVSEAFAPSLGLTYGDGSSLPTVLCAIGAYIGKDGKEYRVLTAFADGTVALSHEDSAVWQRYDGLAGAKQVAFVDLPSAAAASGTAQSGTDAPGGVVGTALATLQGWWENTGQHQLRLQLLQLKEQLQMSSPDDAAELAALRHHTSDKLLPYRDTLGFRRLLLVLTEGGALYALHSGDGHVVWSWRGLKDRRTTHMLTWRIPHSLQQAPEVVVITADRTKSRLQGIVLDVHSGKQQGPAISLPSQSSRVLRLPTEHVPHQAVDQHHYAILSGHGDHSVATSLPTSSPVQDVFFWETDAAGWVHGYRTAIDSSSSATRMWSVAVAGKGEVILSVQTPDPTNPVHSNSKVLGDRSLKFKYVSPQLLFIAVGPPQELLLDSPQLRDASITVWLLNGVTGQVLHVQKHQGARGPVHASVCENWVMYHYLRLDGHRYQISVIELYDDKARHLTLQDVLFAESTVNVTRTASQYTHVEVLKQSFIPLHLPSLRLLTTTTTLQGISTKLMLLGTETGQVYGLERRLLDARRAIRPNNKPTAEDMEEGLIPYSPLLPFKSTSFLTTDKYVANLHGIASAATQLESTSLVLAYGTDLYFTRVTPSASFDSLPVDFPYALLLAVTSAMLLASLLIQRLADAKALKDKWA